MLAAAAVGVVRRAERRAGAADRRSSPTCSSSTGSSTRSSRAGRLVAVTLRRRGRGALRGRPRGRARRAAAGRRGRRHRAPATRSPPASTVSLLEGRPRDEALRRPAPRARSPRRGSARSPRCRPPPRSTRYSRDDADADLLDCDPGHDDAIALLLALASPEVELVGVTTVAGNQTLEKTTANALRVLELAGRGDVPVAAGAGRPLVRERDVAAHVHGETGSTGRSCRRRPARPSRSTRSTSSRARSAPATAGSRSSRPGR